MFTEPLTGWREVRVREQRTKVDWAIEMEHLLTTRYKDASKVILVCDNLNTHTRGAFYEAFPAEKARQLIRRIEFRYTPKHGSWLNMAENELSVHDAAVRQRSPVRNNQATAIRNKSLVQCVQQKTTAIRHQKRQSKT